MTVARLRAPYGRGVVRASSETAKRYKAAGWVEVKDESEKPKATTRKRAAKADDDEK